MISKFLLGSLVVYTYLMALSLRAEPGDTSPLVGSYSLVRGSNAGEKIPKDKIEADRVQITQDRIVVTDAKKAEVYVATYKLDTTQKPWAITMVSDLGPSKGDKAIGLVEKQGDTVKLIYALPGAEPPVGFKAKEKQLLMVMKKAKDS